MGVSDWITTADAAKISGYHAEHLRRLIREGRIRAQKFGIVWQIDKASLLAYLSEAQESKDKRWGPQER